MHFDPLKMIHMKWTTLQYILNESTNLSFFLYYSQIPCSILMHRIVPVPIPITPHTLNAMSPPAPGRTWGAARSVFQEGCQTRTGVGPGLNSTRPRSSGYQTLAARSGRPAPLTPVHCQWPQSHINNPLKRSIPAC